MLVFFTRLWKDGRPALNFLLHCDSICHATHFFLAICERTFIIVQAMDQVFHICIGESFFFFVKAKSFLCFGNGCVLVHVLYREHFCTLKRIFFYGLVHMFVTMLSALFCSTVHGGCVVSYSAHRSLL